MAAAGSPRNDDYIVRTAREDELARLSQLIAHFQARPDAHIAYFGSSAGEIEAEILGWGEDWREQCLVAESDNDVLGFVGVEVDNELGRAWIYGPYVQDGHWDGLAARLLQEATAIAAVDDLELVGDAAHERLGALAERHGFTRGRRSTTLEIDREQAARLPPVALPRLDDPHRDAFVALHEALFPRTYYSGTQLAEQGARGEATILALIENSRLLGYAVGRIQSSGEGYLDFVGVVGDARGAGRGGLLVTAICQALLEDPHCSKVALTVYEDNAPALALYARLGFTQTARLVGYRRRPEDGGSS